MKGRAGARLATLTLLAIAACSHGPAPAAPDAGHTVVLVSLDGFRADYLDRYDAPNLRALAAHGVRAQWMTPVYPSLTFPNHYTIVTGLYPAHHGIVNNTMIDPVDGRRFRINDTAAVRDSRWWQGEPIWVTAVKQGLKAGVVFWPGSEAAIEGIRPTTYLPYQDTFPNSARVDTILSWISRPDTGRIRLALLYFSAVDHAGHDSGPDAPQTAAAVALVDSMIGRLVNGIAQLGLGARVNVIVVADHGMAPVALERTIVLDDFLDLSSVTLVTQGEVLGLMPRDGNRARVVAALRPIPHLQVYDRDSVPARWHYTGNARIPPVVGTMDVGWELVTRTSLEARRARTPLAGAHGYNDQAPEMRALFVAQGPAFKQGVVVPSFRNIHVYDLMCRILGITPAPNDGSPDSTAALLR